MDRVEDIPSVLEKINIRGHVRGGGGAGQQPYLDRVEPAESREGDEKNKSTCNPFCEWVTFGGNALRNRA